ncbi:hypothetical protein DFP72DRAFT_792166, partial [Ephemerocybe angulata]
EGVQFGIGKAVTAIVDCDVSVVYNVEDRSREHITIIETVCADGTVLPPIVIFQEKKI